MHVCVCGLYACVCLCVHMHAYACVCVCVHMHVCVCVYICMCVCVACMLLYVGSFMCKCACVTPVHSGSSGQVSRIQSGVGRVNLRPVSVAMVPRDVGTSARGRGRRMHATDETRRVKPKQSSIAYCWLVHTYRDVQVGLGRWVLTITWGA